MTDIVEKTNVEVWRPIEGWVDYEVSNLGNVRSWRKCGRYPKGIRARRAVPKILRLTKRTGYPSVTLSDAHQGKSVKERVHILVLTAFKGCKPHASMQGAHLDGNEENNAETNLEWKTPAENNADKLIHGTQARGELSSTAKITNAQASYIRSRRKDGAPVAEMQKEFSVSRRTIERIISGHSFRVMGNG